MANEHETAVALILNEAGVAFRAVYIREAKRALGGDAPMDQWSISFTRGDGREAREEFDFFTGLGYRVAPEWKFGVRGYDNGPAPRRGSLLWETWQKQAKTKAPHPACVLHSLILDSSAVGQSFEDWCEDFGTDSDSRKALATYKAGQQNADKLRRVFSRAQIEALSVALEGY